MSDEKTRSIFVEAPSGEKFEADVPCGTKLSAIAADFFEAQGMSSSDRRGRRQRAVIELVHPDDPSETKRLNGDDDICDSLVEDGSTLRVFSESIAGATADVNARERALIADHKAIKRLARRDPDIQFEANRSFAPDRYLVTLTYESFIELPPGLEEPLKGAEHQIEILLTAAYPRYAPIVKWLTPIFHPNVSAFDGSVCLGVLDERYSPSMGVAKLVRMLAEMVQWRNYDASNAFNPTAARWAGNLAHWEQIKQIGGYPLQGPVGDFIAAIEKAHHTPIVFRRH